MNEYLSTSGAASASSVGLGSVVSIGSVTRGGYQHAIYREDAAEAFTLRGDRGLRGAPGSDAVSASLRGAATRQSIH